MQPDCNATENTLCKKGNESKSFFDQPVKLPVPVQHIFNLLQLIHYFLICQTAFITHQNELDGNQKYASLQKNVVRQSFHKKRYDKQHKSNKNNNEGGRVEMLFHSQVV